MYYDIRPNRRRYVVLHIYVDPERYEISGPIETMRWLYNELKASRQIDVLCDGYLYSAEDFFARY